MLPVTEAQVTYFVFVQIHTTGSNNPTDTPVLQAHETPRQGFTFLGKIELKLSTFQPERDSELDEWDNYFQEMECCR